MINIIALTLLITITGYLVIKTLLKDSVNPIVIFGISFGAGVGLNATIFFLYSFIFSSKIGLAHIVTWLFIVTGVTLFYVIRKKISFSQEVEQIKRVVTAKYHPVSLLVVFVMFSLILASFYNSLLFPFGNADEWSYWGTATKRIYQFGTVDLRGMGFGGFEKYPLLVPITSASIDLAAGNFYENFSRSITPLFTLFTLIFLIGFLKEFKFKNTEITCFSILLLTAGNIYSAMAATLYADVQLGYFYSLAVMIFLLSIKKPEIKKQLYLISGAFFSFSAFTKIEALYICLATVFGLIILDWLYHKNKMIDYLFLIIPSLFLPVLWYFYGKIHHLGTAGWTEALFADTAYAFQNFSEIIKNMARKTIRRPMYYTTFWLYVAGSSIVGLFTSLKNKYYVITFLVLVANFFYLLASYLFIFNAPTIAVLASFERYIIHFLPLSVLIMAFVYQDVNNRWLKRYE